MKLYILVFFLFVAFPICGQSRGQDPKNQKAVKDLQIPYTIGDRETTKQILITMQMGFESMNKRIDTLERNIDKRITLIENLLFVIITILVSAVGAGFYALWQQKNNQSLYIKALKEEIKKELQDYFTQELMKIIKQKSAPKS